MYLYVIGAVVFAIASSFIAYGKGRNSLGWFLAGLLIGPFALVIALLPPRVREGRFVQCAKCAEVIPADAQVCRFCGATTERVEMATEPAS